MLPRNHPDRIQITFDDRRLVANAGLLLPATLARHLGLVQSHPMVRLVDVPVNTFVGSLLGTPDPVTDSPGLDGAALGCRRPDKPQSLFWPQSHFGMPSGTPPRT